MPCQDYESNSWEYQAEAAKMKTQADKLARIACKAMTALEENGIEDFLLLKDDEVRVWWLAHKEADRKEQARIAEIERRERVKSEALARLSDEEKELLGLSIPKRSKRSRSKSNLTVTVDDDVSDMTNDLLDAVKYLDNLNNGKW
jgi:hypothetical protein